MKDASTQIGSDFIEDGYNPFIISGNKKVWIMLIMFFVIIISIFIGLIISGLGIHTLFEKTRLNNFVNYYPKNKKREVK